MEEGISDPLWLESETEGRPQQVFCYKARDETGGIGSGGKEGMGGKKETICGIHRGGGQERLPQVYYCRAGGKTKGLDLGVRRKKRRSMVSLPDFPSGMPMG